MRWRPGGRSTDLEDRRGQSGGGGGFIPGGGMRLGLGGIVVLLVLSLVFKQDFFSLLAGAGGDAAPAGQVADGPVASTPEEDRMVQFVSFVFDDVQKNWEQILPPLGVPYRHAKLVLFRDEIQSACGFAETASGPFYCPGDEKVYIDLGFFDELSRRFGAPGDFAQAYVLAHELGHHVQKLLGTEAKMREAGARRPDLANQLSVKLELQADCYAGIWANSTQQRDILERGDIEEGLGAAAAVGDDRIQRMTTGHVNPETFTHGTSADRERWFREGFSAGRLDACDTFRS
ncbi:MAG TPA: neutral zinc metallopeptidase [Gemmatimonadales bacterium]|nr:neutral zinc metallopeptidase [Gemmatimonadales bacterium]